MRLTSRLYAQHLGWTFKKHWLAQGKRVARDTGAAEELKKHGIQVKDVKEVLNPVVKRERIKVVGFKPVEVPQGKDHPNWHDQVCYTFGDENVLLEGLHQAQILTNTIVINQFPRNIEQLISQSQLSTSVDQRVKAAIMASHIYDAEQVKLPKRKLPDRPAYNLPREYGISAQRKMRLLINKLITECEKLVGLSVTSRRRLIDNADSKVTLSRDEDILQFVITAEKMITSTFPITPVARTYHGELPDIYPLKPTITMPKKHIYTEDNFYLLSDAILCSHPHTIFLHFEKEKVSNLHETPVTTTQFQGRTMLKAFVVAASRAKQLYGDSFTGTLPKPIVVQSVQTDGKCFHFGVFQLNTLSLSSADDRNYWFHQPNMELFSECEYKEGRPSFSGYNSEVFRILNAFYNNS